MIVRVDCPIDSEIVQQHIRRAAALLADSSAAGLLFFRNTNILGFCGVPLGPSDRLICGLMNADAQLAFIVPEFESEMTAGLPDGSRVFTWREDEDPYALVALAAEQLGIARERILLDPYTWIAAQRRLADALAGATLTPDPGVIESVRKYKSQEEIAAIRAACLDTGRIYALVAAKLRAGVTEKELSREVLDELEHEGITPFGDLIQGGASASVPHQPTGNRRFREGDAVIVDFVSRRMGYLGDMTRTLGVTEVSDEIFDAYHVVKRAQAAAIAAARPGVTCEALDQIARDVIVSGGLGDYFVHRLGHGIGLDVHEPPYLVRGNTERLEVGVCVTVEPGVYVPGRFGIRIEDVIAITPDGCEVLSGAVATDVSPAFEKRPAPAASLTA